MYRAYWAIPRTLKTSKGEQTNTVFGVASMLISILQKELPDVLLFCFDKGEETFRHTEAVDYKAGRAETPDDFYVQIPRVMQVIESFGIKHVADAKWEADDFLCSYAKAAEKEGMRVTIVTGDRDALQLASDRVKIAIPQKGYSAPEYLGPEEIVAKYGIRPDQVASYKGLCGDPSDNLSGVRGIGPKTAATLLQNYDTLDGIYEHLEEISASVRTKLEADKEHAYFCRRMAELICDIPLPASLEEITLKDLPVAAPLDLFRELQFTLLGKRLQKLAETDYGKKVFAQEELIAVQLPPQEDPASQLTLF